MDDKEIDALDLAGWPLPDAYLIEIGRVGALWSNLESMLNICLTKLFGFTDDETFKGFIITAHSSFPQRLDMMGALCEQLVPDHPSLAGYKAVISSLRMAQTERNRIAHNGVTPGEAPGEFMMPIGSARGSVKTRVSKITLTDIRRVVIVLDEAGIGLFNLIFKTAHTPVWTRRQRR